MSLRGDPRLPIRIAIMLFDEHFHRRKGVVIHLATQATGRPIHHYVFVYFVIAAIRYGIRQFLVTTGRMPEKTKVPIGVIRVTKPSPHEHEATVDPITCNSISIADGSSKFILSFRRQRLISVQDKNPFVAEGKMV